MSKHLLKILSLTLATLLSAAVLQTYRGVRSQPKSLALPRYALKYAPTGEGIYCTNLLSVTMRPGETIYTKTDSPQRKDYRDDDEWFEPRSPDEMVLVEVPPTMNAWPCQLTYHLAANDMHREDKPFSMPLPAVRYIDNPAAHFPKPMIWSGIAGYTVLILAFIFGDRIVRGEPRRRRKATPARGFEILPPH